MRTDRQRKYHREYYREWRKRNGNADRRRVREKELYRLNHRRIRARKRAYDLANRPKIRAKARLRYQQQRSRIRNQKRAAYQKNIIENRIKAIRWRHRNLTKCRERDRLCKWRKSRREGRATLEQLREYASRPEIIAARKERKKQYNAAYSRKHRDRLTKQARFAVLKRYAAYQAYNRQRNRNRVVSPAERARWSALAAIRRQGLVDGYVKTLICQDAPAGIRQLIPPELIDLKRSQVCLTRAIKARKEGKCIQAKLAA